MSRRGALAAGLVLGLVLSAAAVAAAAAAPADRRPGQTLFIGVDTSGSFRRAGYDDALAFVAYYIYGHLHELGRLGRARELFVAPIGGTSTSEPKAFRPIHDFEDKDVARIEGDLRAWLPPTDSLTDFNVFFREVARIARERNLLLTPITVLVVSDGIPDVPDAAASGATDVYRRIDFSALEYLSKNVTVRLAYASPKVGGYWRSLVPRQRVRFWAVEREVMLGWRAQMKPDAAPGQQERLWKWVRENVDFRVRRGI